MRGLSKTVQLSRGDQSDILGATPCDNDHLVVFCGRITEPCELLSGLCICRLDSHICTAILYNTSSQVNPSQTSINSNPTVNLSVGSKNPS